MAALKEDNGMKRQENSAAIPLTLTRRDQIRWVVQLSVPAILAQISSIAMQYIDAAMVGSLGAEASAAVGLVTSTTWMFGGLCASAAVGFSVQVAHRIGAGEEQAARGVMYQALWYTFCFGILLAAIGVGISGFLPQWLGGEADVCPDSTRYFRIYALALTATQLRRTAGGILQCSGDMKTPSALNALMCLLDVGFNALLIFPSREIVLFGRQLSVVGAGMGVSGAALGTALSEGVTAALMLYVLLFRSPVMRWRQGESRRGSGDCWRKAIRLASPVALEHIVLSGAQIMSTRIIAPLGTLAVAANSLAVIAESLCYMPGYGIAEAATTLVGQSMGARRSDAAQNFARLAVALGVLMMSCTGGLMFLFAPQMFRLLTPVAAIQGLGVQILRIEAFAEPLYAVSIVAAGALRGAGDTLLPSVLNLVSMWGVRITAAAWLAPRMGLTGVWLAMCGELCFRGVLFLIRLMRGRWLKNVV